MKHWVFLPLIVLTLSSHASKNTGKVEEYGCSITVHDLQQGVKEEKAGVFMKADSKMRTYTLDSVKVIAKVDVRSLDKTNNKVVNSYWANHRAVTVAIVNLKDEVQAQMNNTVDSKTGTFEYQTKTTQYFVKLHCDPVTKIIVAR